MTGEMASIDKHGTDSNGDHWPLHARVARRLRCKLRPFDKYTGPYIAHPAGKIFLSMDTAWEGTACLWPGGIAPAFRKPLVSAPFAWNDRRAATAAARQVLKQAAGS